MPASGRAVRERGLRAFTVGQGRVVARNKILDLSLIWGYVLFVSSESFQSFFPLYHLLLNFRLSELYKSPKNFRIKTNK